MKIRKFTAPTMPEAMKLIKKELGDAAVILGSQRIETEAGTPMMEVTAALDSTDYISHPRTINPIEKNSIPTASERDSALKKHLISHGVLPDISTRIDTAASALLGSGFDDFDTLDMVLGKLIPFVSPVDALSKKCIHIFVGPTGAGKSTLMCKFAVQKKVERAKITMISLDNQKVGAFEQVKIFADAMGEDVRFIRKESDYVDAVSGLKDVDYILVDMPGLNPWKKDQIRRIKEKIDRLSAYSDLPVDVHLVMPATLNPQEMAAMPVALSVLDIKHILFTKFDETSYFGGLTNVAINSGLPVCYVSDGPVVPDDIMPLNSSILAEKLVQQPRSPWG